MYETQNKKYLSESELLKAIYNAYKYGKAEIILGKFKVIVRKNKGYYDVYLYDTRAKKKASVSYIIMIKKRGFFSAFDFDHALNAINRYLNGDYDY